MTPHDEVTVIHDCVEEPSGWQQCLQVNHQLQEPLAVLDHFRLHISYDKPVLVQTLLHLQSVWMKLWLVHHFSSSYTKMVLKMYSLIVSGIKKDSPHKWKAHQPQTSLLYTFQAESWCTAFNTYWLKRWRNHQLLLGNCIVPHPPSIINWNQCSYRQRAWLKTCTFAVKNKTK